MTSYDSVPDDVLIRMAQESSYQVQRWGRALIADREAVERDERMVARWTEDRDAQYQALDERDIPADILSSGDPS